MRLQRFDLRLLEGQLDVDCRKLRLDAGVAGLRALGPDNDARRLGDGAHCTACNWDQGHESPCDLQAIAGQRRNGAAPAR